MVTYTRDRGYACLFSRNRGFRWWGMSINMEPLILKEWGGGGEGGVSDPFQQIAKYRSLPHLSLVPMKPDSSIVFYLWMDCLHSVTQPNYVASLHLPLTLLQFLLSLESWQFSVLAESVLAEIESASLGEVVEAYWSTRSVRWGVVVSSWVRLCGYVCACEIQIT